MHTPMILVLQNMKLMDTYIRHKIVIQQMTSHKIIVTTWTYDKKRDCPRGNITISIKSLWSVI